MKGTIFVTVATLLVLFGALYLVNISKTKAPATLWHGICMTQMGPKQVDESLVQYNNGVWLIKGKDGTKVVTNVPCVFIDTSYATSM